MNPEEQDKPVRDLIASVFLPPDLCPTDPAAIEAMLDAAAVESLNDEQIERMLKKANGELPVGCENFGIEHNPHKGLYKQRVEDVEGPLWISDEERRKAIETDDFWVCVWLPVGSDEYRARAACCLRNLLEFVSKEAV